MPDTHNNTQDNFCDLLAAYELGLLESDECLRFETHLSHCPDCTEELYAMAPTAAAMTAKPGQFARQVEANLQTESVLARLNRFLFSGLGRVLVPVAVAAVLAMLVFMPRTEETKFRTLSVTEAPLFSPIQVRAGGGSQWLPLWESGMLHYRNGTFEPAADDLSRMILLLSQSAVPHSEQYSVLDNAHLYLGVSYLLSGQESQAVRVLKVAAQSTIKPVQQKAQWSLTQAYLILEQPGDAIAVLNQLQDSPVFKTRASELMEKINELLVE